MIALLALLGPLTAPPLALPAAALQEPPAKSTEEPAEEPAAPPPQGPSLELTLDEAITIAVGNNLDIQLAEVQTEVSRFDELGSWGAFDWVFDASYQYQDSTREGSSFLSGGQAVVTTGQTMTVDFRRPLTTGGSVSLGFSSNLTDSNNAFFNDPRQTTDNLSLSYVQPLLRGAWGRYATSVQREREVLFRRQVEVQRKTRQDTAYAVHLAYWDLVSAIEQLDVAQSGVELGENRLQQEQRRLAAGVGTEVDVLQSEADLAVREESRLQAANDVEQRRDDLKKLLFAGKDEELWELVIVPMTGLPEAVSAEDVPDWRTAKMTALEMRSDLRQGRLDVEAARIRHTRALSERLSGLDLTLSASSGAVDPLARTAFQDTTQFDFPTYTALVTYNLPIGNRTADYAERGARAQIRSAQIQYDRTELNVEAEVRAAVRNVTFAAEQVRATATSLELAQRQVDAEEARFAEGLSTTFLVLEFQQSLIEAMQNERLARAGFVKAQAALINAQGLMGEEGEH